MCVCDSDVSVYVEQPVSSIAVRYGDGEDKTVEENSSIFSLI